MPSGPLIRLGNALRDWPELEIWYHPEYRLPLSSLEAATGLELRRADYVAWYLLERRLSGPEQIQRPERIGFGDLALVHTDEYLESLQDPEVLARAFGVDPSDVPVEPLLGTIRLACGATCAATRRVLGARGKRTLHAFNLLGGFHHAARSRGGGNCAVNDIAVAIAALRRDGFDGHVWVMDLDAHPPDGLAECLRHDGRAHISSLSGSDWGSLPGVDETRLPPGCTDAEYLAQLRALLLRHPGPPPGLAFVIAGGDVVAADRLGTLGLTEAGVRRRDLLVARALRRVPTVWLPGGGYQRDAWRVTTGTALVLLGRPRWRISPHTDPLSLRYASIARSLDDRQLAERDELITQDDLLDMFSRAADRPPRLLGFYTAQGAEHALQRYGFLAQVERLGYSRLRVAVDFAGSGDRLRVFGQDPDLREHVLVEAVMAKQTVGPAEVLFLNWLTLRHPRASFSALRPPLPGQDVPGLGMAREASELLAIMARRLGLHGIAFRPSWYHMAYAARHTTHFIDPAREGRFQALVRDLAALPLLEATQAVDRGEVWMDGAPYTWEADDMVHWASPDHAPPDQDAVRRERDRVSFTVHPAAR